MLVIVTSHASKTKVDGRHADVKHKKTKLRAYFYGTVKKING